MVCRNPLLQPQIRKQSLGPSLVAAHGKSPRRSKTMESRSRLAVEIVFQQPAKGHLNSPTWAVHRLSVCGTEVGYGGLTAMTLNEAVAAQARPFRHTGQQ